MRELKADYRPESLALSVWLTGELNQHERSSDVDLGGLFAKIVEKKVVNGLDEAGTAEAIEAAINLTRLYGCCVLVKLAAYIIDGKNEDQKKAQNQPLAHYITTSALHYLNARAKKSPMTEMELEFAKFVLSIADRIGFLPFATTSLDELKKAVGYGD